MKQVRRYAIVRDLKTGNDVAMPYFLFIFETLSDIHTEYSDGHIIRIVQAYSDEGTRRTQKALAAKLVASGDLS